MGGFHNFFKNTIIFTISNFSSKILVFLLLPLYTRTMSSNELGDSDLIITLVSFVFPILSLCVSEGVLRFGNNKQLDSKQVFSIGMYIILIGFAILLFCFKIVSIFVSEYLLFFYTIYLFSAFSQYFNQFLRSKDQIMLIGVTGVISTIIVVVCNIIFLCIYNLGANGYLLSYTLMYIFSSLILFFKGNLYKYISKMKLSFDVFIPLMKYNLPLIPNKTNWWLISVLNRYVLRFMCGASSAGIYIAASKIPTIINTVYSIVQQALLLSLIDIYDSTNENSFYSNISSIMAMILEVLVLVISLCMCLLSNFLFGTSYDYAWKICPLLILSAYFGSLHGNLATEYLAKKETQTLFANSCLGAIASLILNVILIYLLDINGAVISAFLTYLIVWFHLYMKSKYRMSYKHYLLFLLLTIQSGSSLFLNKYLFFSLSLLFILIFFVVYFDDIKKILVIILKYLNIKKIL